MKRFNIDRKSSMSNCYLANQNRSGTFTASGFVSYSDEYSARVKSPIGGEKLNHKFYLGFFR